MKKRISIPAALVFLALGAQSSGTLPRLVSDLARMNDLLARIAAG